MTNDVQVVVRLPSSVVQELDALAEKLSKPGLKVTRATVLRMLAIQGLASGRVG